MPLKKNYPAFIHKEADSDFGVSFPDFPGCATAGQTLEEAHEFAIEALQLHVDGLLEDDDDVPDATPLDLAYAQARESGAVLMVVPVVVPDYAKRINITIAEGLLRDIETARQARGLTRSAFLAEAARRLIDEERAHH